MSKIKFSILFLIGALLVGLTIASCNKENDQPNLMAEKPTGEVVIHKLDKNWEEGSYLTFKNQEEFEKAYNHLVELLTNQQNVSQRDGVDECFEHPELDEWEEQFPGFVSMRRAYEIQECDLLDKGFDPSQTKSCPELDDALATLMSVDGIVQISNKIRYKGEVVAEAEISKKDDLRDIVRGTRLKTPEDEGTISIGKPIDTPTGVTFRGGDCPPDFSVQLNYNNLDAFITYSGTPLNGDSHLVWSIGGSTDTHEDETSFNHHFASPDSYNICAAYTAYDIVNDTTWFYTISSTKDTIITDTSGVQQTIKINKIAKQFVVGQKRGLICSGNFCKTINFTDECIADFTSTVGIGNTVSFVDKSSVKYGTITAWEWDFGDGTSSTERNPTHTYPCNKEFTVTLVIKSTYCPNGQASTSKDLNLTGLFCCDRDAKSSWKWKKKAGDDNKKIKYRYDLGADVSWWDQIFKAKIKYFEYRKGGIFGKKKWRKTKGDLDVNFMGNVFANDNDGCECNNPRELIESPAGTVHKKSKVFKDNLGGVQFGNDKQVRVKEVAPVMIEYIVNGHLYLTQNTANSSGFVCEQN